MTYFDANPGWRPLPGDHYVKPSARPDDESRQRANAISLRREIELLRQRHGEWCRLTWPHEGPCIQRSEAPCPDADIEPGDELTSVLLCGRCMAGEGGECHTPGCALWLNRAPDVPMWGNVTINEAMTPSEDESHSGRSDA
jgi:hypothetical protein